MTLLGRRQVRELVDAAGVSPTKSHGQNFLCDPNTVRRIVKTAEIDADDRVLEVGVGVGSLTTGLVDAGAYVVGIEVDDRLADAAKSVLPANRVLLVREDATGVDWPALVDEHDLTKMVSNLPYSVGTSVLVSLLDEAPALERFVVMVQLEVGERLAAGPGDDAYGAVSVRTAYHGEAKLVGKVAPSVFHPKPEVESALVRIDRRQPPRVRGGRTALVAVVNAGFGQRRKTMRKALSSRWPVEVVDAALKAAGIDPSARAETLGLAEFVRLTDMLDAAVASTR